MTELSARTNAAGLWNLPGGGLDPGEEPTDAVVREVHEETGQRVVDVALLTVMTRHWVERAPSGRVEDFHAVRLFHTAHCPEPTDPVVLDVGGSTSAARWVHETELASLPLASSVPEALAVAGVSAWRRSAPESLTTQTRQSEDDEQDAGADDGDGSDDTPGDVEIGGLRDEHRDRR